MRPPETVDMLPAPYDFDASQLCVNPLPILQDAIHKLTLCEGVVDERTGWLATVSYVLRVLDFVVGLSAGLEEGQREGASEPGAGHSSVQPPGQCFLLGHSTARCINKCPSHCGASS